VYAAPLTVDAELVDRLHKLLVHLHTPHHARLLAAARVIVTLQQQHSAGGSSRCSEVS
jgi:hypothetical protein